MTKAKGSPPRSPAVPMLDIPKKRKPANVAGEIVGVLSRKIDGIQISGTVAWLAKETGASRGAIAEALHALRHAGKVTYRVIRTGDTLWKLTDANHAKWARLSGWVLC